MDSNKEVFDAEVFAIYQALRIIDRRHESGRRYTLFVDSTAAMALRAACSGIANTRLRTRRKVVGETRPAMHLALLHGLALVMLNGAKNDDVCVVTVITTCGEDAEGPIRSITAKNAPDKRGEAPCEHPPGCTKFEVRRLF